MKILLTGIAGFIGSHLALKLASEGHEIIGIDNLNDYYDPSLKFARLENLGFELEQIKSQDSNVLGNPMKSDSSDIYFYKLDLTRTNEIMNLFAHEKFDVVLNFAAQAGARDSLKYPGKYVRNNIDGFLNILEGCRAYDVKHLIYASSSSVYGLNRRIPFSESDSAAHPASIYAATKRSNELLAHAYSYNFGVPTTGLRLFTVYGPWGRPDMSPFLFIDSIINDKPLRLFNHGEMMRDFTYIEDIVEAVNRIITLPPVGRPEEEDIDADPSVSSCPFRILNIGNSSPVKLIDYVGRLEKIIGKKAIIQGLPLQPGDVVNTYADTEKLELLINFHPNTDLSEGLYKTVEWYRSYYK